MRKTDNSKQKPGFSKKPGFVTSNIRHVTQADPAVFTDPAPAILLDRDLENFPGIYRPGQAGLT